MAGIVNRNPFGQLLRDLRRRHGLSQAELAGTTCTRAHVSAIEKGHGTPSGFVVRRFFECLPEQRLLAEAFASSYTPRPDWIHAGIYLALRGEREGARLIFEALVRSAGSASSGQAAVSGRARGWVRYLDGRLDQAVDLLNAAADRHRAAGQYREASWTLWELGLMASESAPGPEAVRSFRAARATWPGSRTLERTRFDAIVLHSEARTLRRLGFPHQARRRSEQAGRLYREAGDPVGEGHALLEQAYAAQDAGYRGSVVLLSEEALGLFRRADHGACLGVAELAVGIGLLDQGPDRLRDAAARIESAARLLAAAQEGREVHALAERARVALALGDVQGARVWVREALALPAAPGERSEHLCLAAAAGLQEWPVARQSLLVISRSLASPWERRAFFLNAARTCESLQRWQWAAELHHLSHQAWEGSWLVLASGCAERHLSESGIRVSL